MRVLVCGGRDFDDAGLMISVLDRLHAQKSFTVLIHGDARGADRMAGQWAKRHGVDLRIFVPDYDQFGPRLAPPFAFKLARQSLMFENEQSGAAFAPTAFAQYVSAAFA